MKLLIALTITLRRVLDLVLVALALLVISTLVVARLIPAITNSPAFVVGGGSMEPTVPLGAMVITETVATTDLKVGDIVSVQVGPQHAIFTHRIIRIAVSDGTTWVQTKGDANPAQDPSMVPASDVLGRVTVTIPGLGYAVQMLAIPQGVAFLLLAGLIALLGTWLLETLEDDQRTWLHRRRIDEAGLLPLDVAPGRAAG